MIRLSQVRAELDEMQKPLEQLAARALKVRPEQIASVRLARKSVDARDKGDVHFSLTLDVETARPLSRLRQTSRCPRPDRAARRIRRWWWAWARRGCSPRCGWRRRD